MNTLPTAQEARRTILAGENLKAQEQMRRIESSIMQAINMGRYSISGNGHLEKSVKEQLTEKGYKIDSGSQYNDPYWSISW